MKYIYDILFFITTFFVYMASAWMGTKIRANEISMYSTVPLSILAVGIGMISLKYSQIPLPVLGAIYDVIAVGGYMAGLVLCGNSINNMQWVGIVLMTVGLVTISYFS